MTYSHLDPVMQNRVAWNADKTVGTKRPLTQKQIWAIRFFLDREERLRDSETGVMLDDLEQAHSRLLTRGEQCILTKLANPFLPHQLSL